MKKKWRSHCTAGIHSAPCCWREEQEPGQSWRDSDLPHQVHWGLRQPPLLCQQLHRLPDVSLCHTYHPVRSTLPVLFKLVRNRTNLFKPSDCTVHSNDYLQSSNNKIQSCFRCFLLARIFNYNWFKLAQPGLLLQEFIVILVKWQQTFYNQIWSCGCLNLFNCNNIIWRKKIKIFSRGKTISLRFKRTKIFLTS